MKASHLEGGLKKEDAGNVYTVERVYDNSENQGNCVWEEAGSREQAETTYRLQTRATSGQEGG